MSDAKPNSSLILKCDRQLHHVAERLSEFYKEKELFDTTLVAGGDNIEVKAHRLVLCMSSEYFTNVFRGLDESESKVIHLSSVDGNALKMVVEFMYTFNIAMSKDSIEKILSVANLFQMKTLTEGCCNLMAEQLHANNCLGFAQLAAQHKYTILYEKSLSYAYKNFEQVSAEEEFLKLTEPQLSKFLSQDEVNTVSQETIFLSLIKWLKYDQDAREESMFILLNDFVRFAQLDQAFVLQNAPSIAHIAKCSKMIFTWLNWHSSKEKKQKRKTKKVILAYLANESEIFFRVDSYDPDINKWSMEDWPQPSKIRSAYGIVITNDKCVIAGGKIGDDYTNSVECLDLKSMVWSYLPPMIIERMEFGMAVLNGNLYVVGGWNKAGYIRLVEKYDFKDGKWTNLADLPVALSWLRAVSADGKLYVSGGRITCLKCYDPATNKWSETSAKNENSSGFGLTASEEYVYAVGGRMHGEVVNTVERYNPSNNTWTIMEPMPTKRISLTCLALGNKLMACGGKNALTRKLVEEYNEQTKEWKDVAECLKPFEDNFDFSDHLSIIYE